MVPMQPLAAIIRVTLAGLGIRVRDFWDPPGGGVGLGYGTLGQNGIRVRDFGSSGEPEGN